MIALQALIKRGDKVSIEGGRLVIIPASGKPVPDKWLASNQSGIIREILTVLQVPDIYVYKYFSVGQYGPHSCEGLTLQFESILSRGSCYAVFNVSLKRVRTTKGGKKGARLPKGQFIPPKAGSFCKFWAMTGLVVPRYNSEYSECINRLKPFHFTAGLHETVNNRFQVPTLAPINTTHKAIAKAVKEAAKVSPIASARKR